MGCFFVTTLFDEKIKLPTYTEEVPYHTQS